MTFKEFCMNNDTGFDLFDPSPMPAPEASTPAPAPSTPAIPKCTSCNGDWCEALDAYYGTYAPFRTYCTRCREAFLKRWPIFSDD